MRRIRFSGPARGDLSRILATSFERWGESGRARYAELISAAIRALARTPQRSSTRERPELSPGVRSFHIRHARSAQAVKDPVHVIFYRTSETFIEIVRVLHERMEPSTHVKPRGRPPRRSRTR
jgi:toxin ParE1/3/4